MKNITDYLEAAQVNAMEDCTGPEMTSEFLKNYQHKTDR